MINEIVQTLTVFASLGAVALFISGLILSIYYFSFVE